jgi:hypothetical protein
MAFRYHASTPGAKREWSLEVDPHGIFCLSEAAFAGSKQAVPYDNIDFMGVSHSARHLLDPI